MNGGGGRNSEYSDVRSRKKIDMRFLNILRHRPSFPKFSDNTWNGTLIFGIYVENGLFADRK